MSRNNVQNRQVVGGKTDFNMEVKMQMSKFTSIKRTTNKKGGDALCDDIYFYIVYSVQDQEQNSRQYELGYGIYFYS